MKTLPEMTGNPFQGVRMATTNRIAHSIFLSLLKETSLLLPSTTKEEKYKLLADSRRKIRAKKNSKMEYQRKYMKRIREKKKEVHSREGK